MVRSAMAIWGTSRAIRLSLPQVLSMKVERISANIRYSQDTGHGAWRVIELGVEASISDKEQWKRRSRSFTTN